MNNVENNFKNLLIDKYPNIYIESLDAYCDKFEQIISKLNELGIDAEVKKKSILSNIGKKDYLNYVCELSVIYHFASKFSEDFKIDINSTNNKNFDFYFFHQDLKMNVEVKSLSPSDNSEKKPVKLFLPKEQENELYKQGLQNLTRTTYKKIMDLLEKADSQLPLLQAHEINIVLLCVSDLDEYTDVVTNLIHSEISILNLNKFKNIDCVLVCNIGFEHNFLLNKQVYKEYIKPNIENYSLDGKLIWDYQRSIPVLPMLFWVNTPLYECRNEEIQKNVMEAMFSHTSYLQRKVKSNNDIQNAIFTLYNEISTGKIS